MEDPIGKMIMDAVTAPYHNEEKALQSLVQSKHTEYWPAPTSEIQTFDIDWDFEEGDVHVSVKDTQTITNPFQLMPTQIKDKVISFKDVRVSTNETGKMTQVTGTWTTSIVGPLQGKSWVKEVPLFIDVMSRTFYTYLSGGIPTPHPIVNNDIQHFKTIYGKMQHLKDNSTPVYISIVQYFLKAVKLPDLPWYNSRPYSGYNPINWNPLTKNISNILGTFWWGDYVLEAPTPSYLLERKSHYSKEDYHLQQGWGLAAANFRQLIDEWIEEAVDEWFTRDSDGWYLEKGWDVALGYYILTAGKVIEENGIIVDNMIDAVMAMELSGIEISSTRQFLLNNQQHLKAFMDTNVMVWLLALQLPLDYEDYINEWLYDYDN
jgi:hypothetical protein